MIKTTPSAALLAAGAFALLIAGPVRAGGEFAGATASKAHYGAIFQID